MKLENSLNKPWVFYALIVIFSALFVHSSTYYIQPDLDGGVVWAINELFNFRQELPVYYPHTNGPLYILKLPTEKAYHLLISTLFNFGIRILLGSLLLRLATKDKKWIAVLVFLFFLIFLNFDFTIIAIVLAGSYYLFQTKKIKPFIPIALLISISLFIKGSVSFPSLFIFIALFTLLIYYKKYGVAFQLGGVLLICTLFLSAILFANPFKGFSYISKSFYNSLFYGSHQAIYFKNSLLLIVPALIFAVTGPLWIRNKNYRNFYFLSILVILIFWKYVLGREDFTHYQAWYYMCFMFMGFSFLLFEGKTRIKTSSLYFLSFLFFMTNVKRGDGPKPININTPSITTFTSAVLKLDQANKIFAQQSSNWNRTNILSDTMLQIIKDNTIDAFPWKLSIIRKYNLNYQPRPNIYSTLLGHQADISDSIHYSGDSKPEFILWHNSQPDRYQLNAHDKIYLANSNPRAITSIQKNYRFLIYQNGYALWKKKNSSNKIKEKKVLPNQKITMNQWFETPTFDSATIFYGKTNFTLPLTDKIRNSIYLGRFFKIIYKLKNQEKVSHFLSLASLQNNFILQPYFINPRLDYKLVEAIKIIPMSNKFSSNKMNLSSHSRSWLQ